MKKIILILTVALGTTMFTSCDFFCKKCPTEGTTHKPGDALTLNYYIYVIDTLPSSPFKYYFVKFNDQQEDTIRRGKGFNISYNPTTENDLLKVRVYTLRTDGKEVEMAFYSVPLDWSQRNAGDTLFQTQIFYNPSNDSKAAAPGRTVPDPICTPKTCN